MKKLIAFLLLGLGLNACQQPSTPLATDQVNGLVGNAGYVAERINQEHQYDLIADMQIGRASCRERV